MIEYIILGIIQGIFDWLPISSEGVLVLAQTWLFKNSVSLSGMIDIALFLHLGSFLAVIVYYWRDTIKLFKTFFNYKNLKSPEKSFLNFLIISSFFTAVLGFGIYKLISKIDTAQIFITGSVIMMLVGFLLLVTSLLQFLAKNLKDQNKYLKTADNLGFKDAVIVGLVQGLAVLPGISRSGSTISSLLLLKIKDSEALKISFFMGLPIILGGNLFLNHSMIFGWPQFVGLILSFVFGIITIHILTRVAQRLSFAWFTLFFGLITIIAGLFSVIVN